MRYSAAGQAGRMAGRPYPAPRDAPHHGELAAAIALVLLLAHLLLAQLALLLTLVLSATDRIGRWRPQWLAVPAGAGLLWALAIGPARAVTGLTAGPRQVLGYLGGIRSHPGHLLHLSGAYAGLAHWLPEQFPLALILASAETLGLCWLQRRLGRGHASRPGLVVAARRRATAGSLRSGAGVVTRDGCCVGVDVATGRPAAISWLEAEGGVLCAGTAPAESGFPLAHAAARRRKPVIVIDLAAAAWLAESLAAVCAEAGAPFSHFGPDGPGYYEPLRGGDPARAATLVMGMIDWAGVGDQQRRSCAAYLTDALAVQSAAPGGRAVPLLDDLARLLTPDGLRERAAQIPAYHPRRDVLADRAAVSAGLLQADPGTATAPAAQLPRLRSSALGRWLQPGPPGAPRVSLGQTVRERGVVLFSLDRSVHGDSAAMIAGLAAADLKAVCGELAGMSVPGDSLAWINGCDVLGRPVLADLAGLGRGAGMAVVLSTTSDAAADDLAADVNVLVARGPAAPALASAFAGRNGARAGGARSDGAAGMAAASIASPGLAPEAGLGAATGDWAGAPTADANAFALLAREPQRRVLPQCRHVPAREGWQGAGGRPGAGGEHGGGGWPAGGRPGAGGGPGGGGWPAGGRPGGGWPG
jgi:hypothetical protein